MDKPKPSKTVREAKADLAKAFKSRSLNRLHTAVLLIILLLAAILALEILTLDLLTHSAVFSTTFTAFASASMFLVSLLIMDGMLNNSKEARKLADMAQELGRLEERCNHQWHLFDLDLCEELLNCYRECKSCTTRELCQYDGAEGGDCEIAQCINGIEGHLGVHEETIQ